MKTHCIARLLTVPAKFPLTLLLLITALCGLAAARPAQAQIYLPNYGIGVQLHYSTGSTHYTSLTVNTQDSAGNFTGTLYDPTSGLLYQVSGTLSYSVYYGSGNISFKATYTRLAMTNRVVYSTEIDCKDAYIYKDSSTTILIEWGTFTSWSYSIFTGYAPGGDGTFDGGGHNLNVVH
jgi:hypothetical protein